MKQPNQGTDEQQQKKKPLRTVFWTMSRLAYAFGELKWMSWLHEKIYTEHDGN